MIEGGDVVGAFSGGPTTPVNKAAFRAGFTGETNSLCGLGSSSGPVYGQRVWGFELINNAYCVNATTGAMNAEDAWNIDKKFDDGLPAKGIILTMDLGFFDFGGGSPQHCTDSNIVGSPTMYQVTDKTITCDLLFVVGPSV